MDAGSTVEKRGLPGVDRPQEETGIPAEAKVDDISAEGLVRVSYVAANPQRDDKNTAVGELVGGAPRVFVLLYPYVRTMQILEFSSSLEGEHGWHDISTYQQSYRKDSYYRVRNKHKISHI